MNNTYNGWTNYETWNINLWLDNEEPLYRAKMGFIRHSIINANTVKEFCLEYFPDGTPDMDDMGGAAAMEAVNWEELSEAWNAEYEEEQAVCG